MIQEMLKVLLILGPIFVAETLTNYNCEGEPVKLCSIEAGSRTILYKDTNIVWDSKFELEKGVVLDANFAWIQNFTRVNEGIYLKKTQFENGSRAEKMCGKVLVSVPPLPDCKPIINEIQDIQNQELYQLNLSLPKSGCGTPHVEAFWLYSQENTTLLRVNAKEKPGTYYACIRGPAMACERNRPHTDYCSFTYLNLSRSSTDPAKTPAEYKSCSTDIISSLILVILVTAVIVVVLWKVRQHFHRRHENREKTPKEENNEAEESQALNSNAVKQVLE